MFAAVAFSIEYNVIQAYEALEEHICLNDFEKQFRELLNYYENTFIGRHHRTGRSQLLFLIRLWNQSETTEKGISLTNNKVKGRHNAFARLRELSLVDIKIDTIHMRTTQQNTRPVYNQINRQLIEIIERRDTIPIITLFEQISYLLPY
ncbi:hypothetical protein HZS_1579 [Henneguya salminicola]|nr:hypothetical protein HZS_1579 [Henneguya salminicola]